MDCSLIRKITLVYKIKNKANYKAAFPLYIYDPLAQLAEHLTFNQGVRSSNLRWITNRKTLEKLDVIGFMRVLFF